MFAKLAFVFNQQERWTTQFFVLSVYTDSVLPLECGIVFALLPESQVLSLVPVS